jgi:hypothetical protein
MILLAVVRGGHAMSMRGTLVEFCCSLMRNRSA